MPASVKSVYLSDFQSHVETKIDLAPTGGLTILVGKTDSGKTAIVRALKLLYYNQPAGYEYIRVGRPRAVVAVEMSAGVKVVRERSKSVSRYRIVKPRAEGDGDPDVTTLEGFGYGTPLEVREVTGVRTVSIGESLDLALNLSEQLDGPFLGNRVVSGPARAKILGSLAGTEEVDAAHAALGADLLHATQGATRLENEIKALDARIAEYDYLPGLARQIAELDAILCVTRSLQRSLAKMEDAARDLAAISQQRTQAFNILARWNGLQAALSHVEYAEGLLAKWRVLSGHKSTLAAIAAQRAEWGGRLSRWAGLDKAAESYVAAADAHPRATSLARLKAELGATREGIAKAQATLFRWAGLPEAEAAYLAAQNALNKRNEIEKLSVQRGRIAIDIVVQGVLLADLAEVDAAAEAVAIVHPLMSKEAALSGMADRLTQVRRSKVVAEANLKAQSTALADAQSLYVDTLASIGVCPVCGSTVSPESISLHIKEVA